MVPVDNNDHDATEIIQIDTDSETDTADEDRSPTPPCMVCFAYLFPCRSSTHNLNTTL